MKSRNEAPNHIILPKPVSFLGWATLLKSTVPHSNPLLWRRSFNQRILCLHWAFSSTVSGTPFLGRGFCQRSVFCSYFCGKALHLLLGREGNFPLKCFLSLSLPLTLFKVYPLEIFNVQDLFLHRVHTLFYVVWLSFLLTKRHPHALLILAEGEECCLL